MREATERPKWQMDCEVFAIRDHESMQLWTECPKAGRFIAVMARSVVMPEGPQSPIREVDGAPVEQAAIVGAEWGHRNQCWHWVQISPPSKEMIGDFLFDSQADKDRWYYLAITDLHSSEPELLAACETALACLVDGDEDDGEAGAELRSAIAKARGQEFGLVGGSPSALDAEEALAGDLKQQTPA